MLDYLWNKLDTFDLLVLIGVVVGALIYLVYRRSGGRSSVKYQQFDYKPNVVASTAVANGRPAVGTSIDDTGIVQRMKSKGRTMAVFYGSQTGTAEELAGRLAKEAKRYSLKALVLDPEECEMDELSNLKEIENSFAVFCMATYGEGDPTDNCQQFYEMVQNGSLDLEGLRFAVFGLGNKTYQHYNAMGKLFDKKFEELGGERIVELGLGDDDANLEEDFMLWRDKFWQALCDRFEIQASADEANMRQYRLELLPDLSPADAKIFKGEMARFGAFERQRPPFDQKNPYLAGVAENRELHKGGERSCRHIEFDLTDSRIRYEAGDHVAVFPSNDADHVAELGRLLNDADLDVVFKLINTDEDSTKRSPFPCPTTYRVALNHYVDIESPLKSHVLKEIANFTSDSAEADKLRLLCSTTTEGLKAYNEYIHIARRGILDILREFPTCKPPLDYLVELLPRLQARYYSISSSPKADPNRLSVTAIVLSYKIGVRQIKGVATNYLKAKLPLAPEKASTVPIFVRRSALRLPHRLTTPVIMIGPGTGLAPFRGFLQDRDQASKLGKEIGPLLLYFGCRSRHDDYIYQEELEEYAENGTLSKLRVAFSRDQAQKVYVQHLLAEDKAEIWRLLQQGAHIYVCGDARNMARDVQEVFKKVASELGEIKDPDAWFKDLERTKKYQADVWS